MLSGSEPTDTVALKPTSSWRLTLTLPFLTLPSYSCRLRFCTVWIRALFSISTSYSVSSAHKKERKTRITPRKARPSPWIDLSTTTSRSVSPHSSIILAKLLFLPFANATAKVKEKGGGKVELCARLLTTVYAVFYRFVPRACVLAYRNIFLFGGGGCSVLQSIAYYR